MNKAIKKVGFFGGSFDPIHFGHLNLAIHMLDKGLVDEVLFCPALCSPFKVGEPPETAASHRLEMLKRVLADIPGFSITSIELDRQGPSYTVETLQKLQKKGTQYRLILSEESAERFFEWKDPEKILELAPPLIGSRGNRGSIDPSLKSALVETPLFDISSTEIKRRLKEKQYCGHLVPPKALDYIAQHSLYS